MLHSDSSDNGDSDGGSARDSGVFALTDYLAVGRTGDLADSPEMDPAEFITPPDNSGVLMWTSGLGSGAPTTLPPLGAAASSPPPRTGALPRTGAPPPEYAADEERTSLSLLNQTLATHRDALLNGTALVAPLRAHIRALLDRHTQAVQAQVELAERDVRLVQVLAAQMEDYTHTQRELVQAINDATTSTSGEGKKLAALAARDAEMAAEIALLEQRVLELKRSRAALRKEIGETNSILESQTLRARRELQETESARAHDLVFKASAVLGTDPAEWSAVFARTPDPDQGTPPGITATITGFLQAVVHELPDLLHRKQQPLGPLQIDARVHATVDMAPLQQAVARHLVALGRNVAASQLRTEQSQQCSVIWLDAVSGVDAMEQAVRDISRTAVLDSDPHHKQRTVVEIRLAEVLRNTLQLLRTRMRLVAPTPAPLVQALVRSALLAEAQAISDGLQVISSTTTADPVFVEIQAMAGGRRTPRPSVSTAAPVTTTHAVAVGGATVGLDAFGLSPVARSPHASPPPRPAGFMNPLLVFKRDTKSKED